MRPDDTEPNDATNLRRQAEEAVSAQPARANGSLSHDEALALVHELQVHQVELELQNEELARTRREAEALRDRYADLYDFAAVGYFTLDADGGIREANLAGAVQLGVERGSLIGARFATFLHPGSRPGFAAFCDRVLARGATEACEAPFAARAGRTAWHAQIRGQADGAGAAGSVRLVVTDITDRVRAEDALREREQNLQGIFRAAPVGIGMVSHRTITQANDQFCRMTGYDRDELIGQSARMLYPSDKAYAFVGQEKYARILDSGIGAVETQWRRKAGGVIDVLLSSSPMDASRPHENVVFVALDITDLHEKERALREYAEDLQRSNEDLERFAYVSSHDLQEPLRSIVSFSQLLERRYRGKLDADADEYIAFIVEGGTRMQALILDLLTYSRVNTKQQELTRTDAANVLAAVERHLEVPLREAGATNTHDPMPVVLADPTQLEQVFANLVSNAIKFRKPDEPLRIHVGARRLDGFWEFSVADNGIGIETEYFDRIFVIFQRLHTNEIYPGTGIGLAIVKRIIDRHGGKVWVESTPGEGTTFFFTLPAA